MDPIASLKEQSIAQTPLLLFEIAPAGGDVERWATHQAVFEGQSYEARVARHNVFEMQASDGSGIDSIPRISISAANADSRISQIEATTGLAGARVTVRFLFYDLDAGEPASETMTVFQGVLNAPEEITESAAKLTAVNRMSLQRVLLPPVRIQRRCPWRFPETAEERAEAVGGGAEGRLSAMYACGYSAGEAGGTGNLDGAEPFVSCNLTRSDCIARGMFDQDGSSNVTRRFGGIEFVPASILVRSHGARDRTVSRVAANEARYNDFVPLVYGTSWIEPPVVLARNDGNLTRMEVVLASGEIEEVLKVVVNNVEIPIGVTGRDMTGSGWWNLFAGGARTGGFNLNFATPAGAPLGDPYGGMAALSIVAPNQINDGGSLPRVKVLLKGAKVERFDGSGASTGYAYSDNPAWILLDVLRRSSWRKDELDLGSFAGAAGFCDETIAATDNNGNPISVKRFVCHLAIRGRRTAADVIRGIRNNARLQLTYQPDGRLAALVENSILLQQPVKPAGSNATEELNGGWAAYHYADGSAEGLKSAILRREDGAPAVRLWSRPIVDTPNRFSIELADELNEFQQDSLSLSDVDSIRRTGQEISGRLVVDGLSSFDQAARTLKYFLDRSIRGNRFIELDTSVKALGQRLGDIIAVTYLKEGLIQQPFRIVKIAPGANYRSVRITAQIHDDAWYNDTNGQLSLIPPTRKLPGAEAAQPSSLLGAEVDEFGREQLAVQEHLVGGSDGTILTEVEVGFRAPRTGRSLAATPPLLALQPRVETSGGTLEGGQTLYYAVTATDGDGLESAASFVVRADIPAGSSTNRVSLERLSLSPATASFSVYRGDLPSRLLRIAAGQSPAATFVDEGLALEMEGAPDPNYSHANFYWRLESAEEQFATEFGPNTVGSSALDLPVNGLAGRVCRLIRGKGSDQERRIVSNTETTITVEPPWEIEPGTSTIFVVADATWRFGGRARSSPARFQVPNRRDEVIQITGRAANAQNVESMEGLSIVTRWRIGGGGVGVADQDVPPQPTFAVDARGDGTFELRGIGFETLINTQTITDGLFTLYYRSELSPTAGTPLAAAIDDETATLTFAEAGGAEVGDMVQLEHELMRVTATSNGGTQYTVERGVCGSEATAHAAGEETIVLQQRTETASFRRAFFGTPEGARWARSIPLPSARLACVELELTNSIGNSPRGFANQSELADFGLRSLRGGQFEFQIEGVLGALDDAAPPLIVPEDVSIRDILAIVKQAPAGADLVVEIRQDGALIASLTIADGQTEAIPAPGRDLPMLAESSRLTLNILGVGSNYPGSDLSVAIRV
jgi:hypothetical protein